jgi:membrane protease YdiL (CAAX protease family)
MSFSRVLKVLVVQGLIVILASVLVAWGLLLLGHQELLQSSAARAAARFRSVGLFAILSLTLPVTLLVSGLLLRARLRSRVTTEPRKPRRAVVLAGMAGGLVIAAGAALIGWLATLAQMSIPEQPWILTVLRSEPGPLLAIFVVAGTIVAPLGEELFYRGWVFPFLAEDSVPLAYLGSAVLFAIAHGHPVAFVDYLFMGAVLAALYRWSGTLWAPVLAHATNNAVVFGFRWLLLSGTLAL